MIVFVRSLNLSNACSIVVYEVLRQLDCLNYLRKKYLVDFLNHI